MTLDFEEVKEVCIYMRSTLPRLPRVAESYNYLVQRLEYCTNRVVLGVVYNKFENCININYIDIYGAIRLHKVHEGEDVCIPEEKDGSHFNTVMKGAGE